MILYIAEKPSVGRAVADALAKPHKKLDGYIKLANGDVVTWCIGHLLELAEPEVYSPTFKRWKKEDIPIIPTAWKHVIKPETKKQFKIIKNLINQADILVNMGDPDRVGQILVDELINYCAVSQEKKDKTMRCLINDMNTAAIIKSLANLRQNKEFVPLATSALARARADWLYGINMTRLCTLIGQFSGYKGVLSIGRVQTPVLGLVVKRDLEIESFQSKPFYEVIIEIETNDKAVYSSKWKPSAACEPYQDEEGRIIEKQLADTVLKKVVGNGGKVVKVSQDLKVQPPPLPYNLSTLQIDASKKFNLNAQQTLDICQQLYERHKLITYPRSDCRYIPEGHFSERINVIEAIKKTNSQLNMKVYNFDFSIKSKAWNDKQVSAHHAIIPTSRSLDSVHLSNNERNIYYLVSSQYLVQFLSPFKYQEKEIQTEISGGLFITRQTETVEMGWKLLLENKQYSKLDKGVLNQTLPAVKKNDIIQCIKGKIEIKTTTPPRHFTDATLLSAMTGIARHVTDPKIKQILRETDGLGTEATRAGIIELLFKRGFLEKKGKEIRATAVGRTLIKSLPVDMVLPDMTAHWESQLEAIAEKKMKYSDFMQKMIDDMKRLIDQVSIIQFSGFK